MTSNAPTEADRTNLSLHDIIYNTTSFRKSTWVSDFSRVIGEEQMTNANI